MALNINTGLLTGVRVKIFIWVRLLRPDSNKQKCSPVVSSASSYLDQCDHSDQCDSWFCSTCRQESSSPWSKQVTRKRWLAESYRPKPVLASRFVGIVHKPFGGKPRARPRLERVECRLHWDRVANRPNIDNNQSLMSSSCGSGQNLFRFLLIRIIIKRDGEREWGREKNF